MPFRSDEPAKTASYVLKNQDGKYWNGWKWIDSDVKASCEIEPLLQEIFNAGKTGPISVYRVDIAERNDEEFLVFEWPPVEYKVHESTNLLPG